MGKLLALCALSMALLAPAAQAAPVTFVAQLSGAAESPPNDSAGTGSATVIFDLDTHTMDIFVTFSGLTGTTTAAHIHCCTAVPGEANVGVATETPSFTGFPLGVTAGSFEESYDLADPATYNAPFLAANGGSAAAAEAALFEGLLTGRAYLNIHSTFRPPGEIRGFLLLPEPSGAALALLALSALLAARRVQRRSPLPRTQAS